MALSTINVTGSANLSFTCANAITGLTLGPTTYKDGSVSLSFVKDATASGYITGLGFTYQTALAAGGTYDVDLDAMTDPTGNAVNFASIKFVYVKLVSATGKLKVGGTGPSNIHSLWFADDSDASSVEQGGPPFFQGSATAVTVDASNKNFRITNTHGSQTADFVVVVGGLI